MTELKTLENFEVKSIAMANVKGELLTNPQTIQRVAYNHIIEQLRREAKKHRKSFETDCRDQHIVRLGEAEPSCNSCLARKFIEDFFNLTDEELK